MTDDVISLTKELIRFKSMHAHPEEIHRCMDFIQEHLAEHQVYFQRIDHNYVPSLLVAPHSGNVPVTLMTHIDVVNGPDELFFPYEENGRLFGRGSIDDKYAVALSVILYISHLEQARQKGLDQDSLPFGLLITGDEEAGGCNGAKHALQHCTTDFCIALDGGSPDKVVVKEKGVIKLKLTSRGKTAHGARPWLGINAIDALIDDYQTIRSFFSQQTDDHWHRTLNFGTLRAGTSHNQVPETAEGVFDIRYTENDDPDELIASIRQAVRGTLEIEMNEPLFHSGDSPYITMLRELRPELQFGFEHGASDARHLSEHNIPGIVWGAEGEMSQHSENEHVVISSVHEMYAVLDEFLGHLTRNEQTKEERIHDPGRI
ncbi:M20 family metallopeptidase [Desulfovermiculus halophilus]|jgi:succinyl-diaminopimelate desuccinylase|uniref:M20 family metallopeptidase n=1 Tax=Desulfovermiculus halophilus TaxID=339722 RepID=UPI00068482AE|nr:M20/M25/M40 family metallo-hydrolase [Desulfovermiculus halophilus]